MVSHYPPAARLTLDTPAHYMLMPFLQSPAPEGEAYHDDARYPVLPEAGINWANPGDAVLHNAAAKVTPAGLTRVAVPALAVWRNHPGRADAPIRKFPAYRQMRGLAGRVRGSNAVTLWAQRHELQEAFLGAYGLLRSRTPETPGHVMATLGTVAVREELVQRHLLNCDLDERGRALAWGMFHSVWDNELTGQLRNAHDARRAAVAERMLDVISLMCRPMTPFGATG